MEKIKLAEKLRSVAAVGTLGAVTLVACGNNGYSTSLEACKNGDNTGIEATMNSNDENDPFIILDYGQDNNRKAFTDDRYNDESANRGLRLNNDYINGVGEVACYVDGKKSVANLVFTPTGGEIRQDFINAGSNANSTGS